MSTLKLQKADSKGRTLFFLVTLCILLLVGCSEGLNTEVQPTRNEGATMVTLFIDFQDGFQDDTIVLRVNGEEVSHKEHVSTKLLLGLADSLEIEVETGSVGIYTNVPTKDIEKTIALEVSADTYIGISIVDGMIEHIISDQPFGYG